MPDDEITNGSSPSTQWTWKKVRVSPAPQGRKPQSPQAASRGALSARNPREPLTLTVKYRGGPEAYYEVKARGRTFRRPGHLAIHDLMCEINQQAWWR